jgi:heat shock protein HslJ
MATTRMACPNMDFEQDFLKALTGKNLTYTIDEGNLLLKDDESTMLEFKKTY